MANSWIIICFSVLYWLCNGLYGAFVRSALTGNYTAIDGGLFLIMFLTMGLYMFFMETYRCFMVPSHLKLKCNFC